MAVWLSYGPDLSQLGNVRPIEADALGFRSLRRGNREPVLGSGKQLPSHSVAQYRATPGLGLLLYLEPPPPSIPHNIWLRPPVQSLQQLHEPSEGLLREKIVTA